MITPGTMMNGIIAIIWSFLPEPMCPR